MARFEDYADLLTTKQAAELLQVHVRTLHRMIERGDLPVYRLPGSNRLRIKKADILASLEPVEPDEPPLEAANLRDAFEVWLEDWLFGPEINLRSEGRPIEVNGNLWSIRDVMARIEESQDIMPRRWCDSLGLPQASTYAQGVRRVRAVLAGRRSI